MQTRVMMQNVSGNILETETSRIVFHTEPIPKPFHKTMNKVTTGQDMSWNGSLHGSNADFEEWQSGMREEQRIILD